MKSELLPQVALGVAAHADDMDFWASGTMAKWAARGADIYLLVLTDGSKGTSDRGVNPADLVSLREQEQRESARLLGFKEVFFGHFEDGMLENSVAVKREVIRRIRQVRPDVVITWDPSFVFSVKQGYINHPDHRAAGQATLDAVFPLARDHLSYPEVLTEGLHPHNVKTVLLINYDLCNYFCDISDYCDIKIKALLKHNSQVTTNQRAMVLRRVHEMGAEFGCPAAEGFMRIDLKP